MRIAATEIPEGNETWSYWSPGGWVIAKLVSGVGIEMEPDTDGVRAQRGGTGAWT